VEAAGIEPASRTGSTSSQATHGTEDTREPSSEPSVALTAKWTGTGPDDPDLRVLVAAWPTLPEVVRIGVLALVRASAAGR